jgi:hypothetical protein
VSRGGPNPAKRENDARLRKGGARVPVTARIDPGLDAWLREHAADRGAKPSGIVELALAEYRARNESLGEFLSRQSSPPVTGC